MLQLYSTILCLLLSVIGAQENHLEQQRIDDVLQENQDLKNQLDVFSKDLIDLKKQMKDMSSCQREDDLEQKRTSDAVSPPLGSIIAWVTRPSTEVPRNMSIDLPEGWVRCDGNLIPHPSAWAGYTTPNINGLHKFLRGGADEAELTLEDETTKLPDHTHNATATADATSKPHSHSYNDQHLGGSGNVCSGLYWDQVNTGYTTGETTVEVEVTVNVEVEGVSTLSKSVNETRPTNMNVIYIMRVF